MSLSYVKGGISLVLANLFTGNNIMYEIVVLKNRFQLKKKSYPN